MGEYVRTLGKSLLGIGVCDRCHEKFPIVELYPDGNSPGLKVCARDRDTLDPYRLPMRPPDRINLPFVRPDVDLALPPPAQETQFLLATEDELGISTEDDEGLEVEQ